MSFKLYHPQIDAAIKKKAALQEVLARKRELAPEEVAARKLRKEIITDELLDNEMAVLAPIQEGMQSVPADEVANAGSSDLRKVNLERFREKLREQYLEGRSADAGKALTKAIGSLTEAQAANQPVFILLHAGKEDAGALDAYIHAYNPAISEYIWAVDIRRKGGSLEHDMLADEPFSCARWPRRARWRLWAAAPTAEHGASNL